MRTQAHLDQALNEWNRKQAAWKRIKRFDELSLDEAMWVAQRSHELAAEQPSFGGVTTSKENQP